MDGGRDQSGLAITVGLVTMVLAYVLARQRRQKPWGRIDLWLQLPMGISFLTFAFGLLKLVGHALPPALLIIWAQVFLAFPLVYALLRTARREWGEEMIEAAQCLGCVRVGTLPHGRTAVDAESTEQCFCLRGRPLAGDLSAVLVLGQGKVITPGSGGLPLNRPL